MEYKLGVRTLIQDIDRHGVKHDSQDIDLGHADEDLNKILLKDKYLPNTNTK